MKVQCGALRGLRTEVEEPHKGCSACSMCRDLTIGRQADDAVICKEIVQKWLHIC